VASQLADARRSVVQARLALAQAAGVAADGIEEAPLAAEAAPLGTEATPPAPVLVERALANRRELRAATHIQDAAQTLARAARADLKRRVDFVVTAGVNTLYESPFLRVFPEEQDVQPYVNGVRFSSPTGYWRSFGRKLEPQFSAQLTFDLPFKNNSARGRMLQEEASFRTSQIQRSDLERTIRDNVVDVAENVRRAAEAVERNREAVGYFEKTLQSSLERYQAGDITLLDTLVTEEDLTRQKQQLVRAVQAYTSLLARLKFETGELVKFNDEGSASESAEFDPAGFVAR
jgi:outer membrane protein TolC